MTDPSNSTPNNSDPNSSNPSSPVPSSPDPSSPDPSFRAPMGDYTKLSRFMGSWPEMSNFRKFGALNAQNLLYLQAELANLEDQLHEIRRRDAMDEKKRQYATSWLELGIKEEGQGSCQYEKAMEIRAKLAEYSMFFFLHFLTTLSLIIFPCSPFFGSSHVSGDQLKSRRPYRKEKSFRHEKWSFWAS